MRESAGNLPVLFAFARNVGMNPSKRQKTIDINASEVSEEFDLYLKHVFDIENGPTIELATKLKERVGYTPVTNADALSDEELADAIMEMAEALHDVGVCMMWTDHLTDRQLFDLMNTKMLSTQVLNIPGVIRTWETFDMLELSAASDEEYSEILECYCDHLYLDSKPAGMDEAEFLAMRPLICRRDEILPTVGYRKRHAKKRR